MKLCVVLLIGIVTALVLPSNLDAAPPTAGEPLPVQWVELEFTARELIVSVTSQVRYEHPAPSGTAGILNPSGVQAKPAGADMARLSATSTLFGRTFDSELWIDPHDAAAFQLENTETGARNHQKTYRFLDSGIFYQLRQPQSATESTLPPDQWTDVSTSTIPAPAGLGPGDVVTGPTALFALAASPALMKTGDSISAVVMSQEQYERITILVKGTVPANVSYTEVSGGTETPRSPTADALQLAVSTEPLDPNATQAFQLLGLEGDLQILIDPETRIPLEISGQVKTFGSVALKLDRVTRRPSGA